MKNKKIYNFWNNLGGGSSHSGSPPSNGSSPVNSRGKHSSSSGGSSSHDGDSDHVAYTNGIAGNTSNANSKNNTSNHVFGVFLNELFKRNKVSEDDRVPNVVYHVTTNIREMGGLTTEGIFRVPGANTDIIYLKKLYNEGKIHSRNELATQYPDIHTQASLLKLFLRELPDPLLTFALYDSFVKSHNESKEKLARTNAIRTLLSQLPLAHYSLLKHLAALLKDISKHSSVNKMSSSNMAIIFGPTVMRPQNEDTVKMIEDARHVNGVFLLMIEEFEYLFNNAELPSFVINLLGNQISPSLIVNLAGKESPTAASKRNAMKFSSGGAISSPLNFDTPTTPQNVTTTHTTINNNNQNQNINNNNLISTKITSNNNNNNNSSNININSTSSTSSTSANNNLHTNLTRQELSSPSSPIALFDDFFSALALRSPPPPPPPSPLTPSLLFLDPDQPNTPPFPAAIPNNTNTTTNNSMTDKSTATATSGSRFSILIPSLQTTAAAQAAQPPAVSISRASPNHASPSLSPLPPTSPRNSLTLDDNNPELMRLLINKTCSILFEKDLQISDGFELIRSDDFFMSLAPASAPSTTPSSPRNSLTLNPPTSPNSGSAGQLSPRYSRNNSNPEASSSSSSPQLRSLLKSQHVNNLQQHQQLQPSPRNISNSPRSSLTLTTPATTSNPTSSLTAPTAPAVPTANNSSNNPPTSPNSSPTNRVLLTNQVEQSPLEQAWSHLIQIRRDCGRPSDVNAMSPQELKDEKSSIKKELREFDLQFKRQHGHLPRKNDKEVMRPLYQRYRDVKSLIDSSTITTSMSPPVVNSLTRSNDSNVASTTPTHIQTPPSTSASNTAQPTTSTATATATATTISASATAPTTNNSLNITPTTISPTLESNVSSNKQPQQQQQQQQSNNQQQQQQQQQDILLSLEATLSKFSSNELIERYLAVKQEKRALQVNLHKYQTDFTKKHGRKVQFVEDRLPVHKEYERYKYLKNEIALIEKISPSITSTNHHSNNNNSSKQTK